MRKVILSLLVTMCIAFTAYAQQRIVTGQIIDEKGTPLQGVSVVSSEENRGTQTDAKGLFAIPVNSNQAVLTFSNVNFVTQTRTVGSSSNISITLTSDTRSLGEVVVTGYGVARRKIDEIGAISTVRASEIENLPSVSIDKALQGKAAGVLVQANNGIPGGSINVRIRGEGSINAGNQPLYIVDGVQFNTRNDGAFTQNNPLSFLNPDDIESIDIIKDAATAAIYGSTASNGVVLITTKKGRAGKTRFSFNSSIGVVKPLKYLDVTNAQEFYRLRLEAVGNANNLPFDNLAVKQNVLSFLRVAGAGAFTNAQADSAAASLQTYDWQDAAINPGQLRSLELSASGGNEKTTFRVSGSTELQETFISKADFLRHGLKFDLTNRFTSRLSVNTSVNLSTARQNNPFATDGSFLGSPAFAAPAIIPSNPIYNADGSYYGAPGTPIANLAGTLNQNIILVNEYNKGFTRTNQLVGILSADYKISDAFSARFFTGLDYRLVQGRLLRDSRTADAFARKGLVQVQSNWNTNVNVYGTLNYNQTFAGKHKVDGLVGAEARRENNESITASGDGFPTFEFQTLNSAANPVTIGEFYTGFRRNGVFGNLNYSYDRRYLVGFTARYDGSSRFGADNQFGAFYGVKAGWNIDQEKFLQNSNVISQLRLRAGYGTVGNDQIGNFDARGLFGSGFVYNGSAGTQFSQLPNPNLKWERVSTLNIGTDFGFFKNRINGAIEVYEKKTSDLLLTQPIQLSTGFGGYTNNVGKLENKGVELTLNVDIVRPRNRENFGWSTTFIFSYNKQEVTELNNGQLILASNNSIQVGQPVGVLFTQPYAGVNAATGRPMWYDSLGNITYQLQNRDRRIIGPTRLPKYQGGLTNNFSFGGFSINAFFNYEYGRLAQDGQVNFLSEPLARINSIQYFFDNRWTMPGQITSVPRQNANTESKSSGGQAGDRTWFKADYIRLKTLTFAYDIPMSDRLVKTGRISSARFYAQGTNLWTYSDTFGYDVEFVGTATGIIPQSRIMTLGVQVGF